MAFEQAKQNFETKTKQAPQKVEGDWKSFKSNAENYLVKKQNEVSGFIGKLEYEGKDKDKSEYLTSMDNALDDLIDGNEATKKEMAEYNGFLLSKSTQFKEKLETEMAKKELKQVEEWMSSHFGEKFDISDNIKTYLSVSEGQRIPLSKIKKEMTTLLGFAVNNMPKDEYVKSKNSLYTILNQYCWGDAEAAKKETALVNEKINFFIKCRDIEKKTGITMGYEDFGMLMTGLIKAGIANKDNVYSVLEKDINKLKSLNKGDFKRLAENVRGEALANLLFAAIISLNKKGNAETIGGIKMIMAVESRVAENERTINKTLADNQRKLGNSTRALKKLDSNVTIDDEIAGVKKEIAEAICVIEECKRDLLLNSAKKSLAHRYLAQDSSNPSNKNVQNTVNLILNAKATDELNNLALTKCKVGNIPELALLRAAQLKVDLSVNDAAVKIWFSQNQNIDGVPLHDVLNKFYKTGEVTERGKAAFEAKLKIEGANLGKIIKKNLEHEKAFAKTFKEIVEKYGSIEKVPKEELNSVAGQLSAYADFLKTMQKTNEKYTANREESFAIFGSKSALLKSEIDAGKARNEYILRQICSVSKFMKIEENLKSTLEQNEKAEKDFDKYFKDIEGKYGSIDKIPAKEKNEVVKKLNAYIDALKTSCLTRISYISRKEDTLGTLPPNDSYAKIIKMEIGGESEKIRSAEYKIAEVSKFLGIRVEKGEAGNPDKLESPLFAPIIQNEINPYMKSINSYGEKIQIAARPLSGIDKRIQNAMENNSRFATFEFQQGASQARDFARSLEGARANMENIQRQILSSIKDPAKIKDMPESMRLQREKYLRGVIENINAELKSKDSPLSKDSILQIKEYADNLDSQKESYTKENFVKGIIFTASIASAVAGGWMLGGLATKMFGAIPGVGSKVANFAIGAFSMSGVSLGSVVGSRLAMEGLEKLGVADFGGVSWNKEDIRDEFVYGFGISLGAVLGANALIGGLKLGATSKTLAKISPRASRLSQSGLESMKGLAKIANPGEWFKSKQGGGLLKSFVAETGEESVQEGMENTAGKIGGPWAEFAASVLSASGGKSLDLQTHGIKTSDIKVAVQGDTMVYNGSNVQQFVSNLESNLASKGNLLYKTTINSNGVVTLEIGKFHIDKKTGAPVQTTFKKFNIYPANAVGNLSPEAEIAGIEGAIKVGGKEAVYTVKTAEAAIRTFGDFKKLGFNVLKTGKNTFKASKGTTEFTIEVPMGILAQTEVKVAGWQSYFSLNAEKLKGLFKIQKYQKAWDTFIKECEGSYEKFIQKYPKIAKHLPVDLRSAMQKMAVLGIAAISGMPAMMGEVRYGAPNDSHSAFLYSIGYGEFVDSLTRGPGTYLEITEELARTRQNIESRSQILNGIKYNPGDTRELMILCYGKYSDQIKAIKDKKTYETLKNDFQRESQKFLSKRESAKLFDNLVSHLIQKKPSEIGLNNESSPSIFDKLKKYFSKSENIELRKKILENEKDLRAIDPNESLKVLEKTEIHGSNFNGRQLTVRDLVDANLSPQFYIKDRNNDSFWLSRAYELEQGRKAFLVYVKDGDKVVARSCYFSNSQASWRFLANYKVNEYGNISWYGKGYRESSLTASYELQAAMSKITTNEPIIKTKNKMLIFAGTSRVITPTNPRVGTYIEEMSPTPLKLSGDFYSQRIHGLARPENATLKNTADNPDFSKIIKTYKTSNEMYGEITVEVYLSKNKDYYFSFNRDSKNRVWISNIELANNKSVRGLGVGQFYLDTGSLTTPAMEYDHQTDGYGDLSIMHMYYVDMFNNYLSKMPLIKEYLSSRPVRPETAMKKEVQVNRKEAVSSQNIITTLKTGEYMVIEKAPTTINIQLADLNPYNLKIVKDSNSNSGYTLVGQNGARMHLESGTNNVGRNYQPNFNFTSAVSGEHLVINISGDRVAIRSNGTNSTKITY